LSQPGYIINKKQLKRLFFGIAQPMGNKLQRARRPDLDMAKGLAILLVVFGHLVARADPAGVEWYEPLRRAVYAFHMPFFLYLSGMVAVFSGGVYAPLSALPRLARARAKRLLLPFFGLGGLIVAGKLVAARVMFVDNQPAGLAAGLGSLVWHTADSPALSIWYLFVLFVFSLAAPLVVRGEKRRLPWLIGLALLLYALPLPAYIYLDHLGRYAIFFALGALAASYDEGWTRFIGRYWRLCLALLAASLVAIAVFGAAWPVALTLLPVGALSMPALHGLVRFLGASPSLSFLGRYSFMIYLFNTLFIGLAKGLMLQLSSWDGAHFLPFAMALMLAGTMGPVGLKRYAFKRVKWLDKMTD
jgi:fucose 4-O-acetylase-like acetyltransferase